MDIISRVRDYIKYIKQNPYIYEIQKPGIELFINFLKINPNGIVMDTLNQCCIEYFLCIWVPQHRKYLSEAQAYNIVYTIQDIYMYIKREIKEEIDGPFILELYGQEYMRLYKSRKLIAQLSGDPVLRIQPLVISFDAYKEYKQKKKKRDSMSMYENGNFIVDEINKDGYISLNKIGSKRYFKVLFRPSLLSNFKVGDILHITLRKRIFFVYWEIEEIKGYYLSNALRYF
ncbi:MAG: hypothetical protein ACRC1P_04175 [Cellulosilyticaceae bacterium]